MKDIKMRKVELHELEEVVSFYQTVLDESIQNGGAAAYGRNKHFLADVLWNAMLEHELCVGELEHEIVAAMIVNHSFTEYEKSEWQKNNHAKDVVVIHSLAVHPEHRRQGTAKMMIRYAIGMAMAEGKAKVQMDVLDTDTALKKTLDSIGFTYNSTLVVNREHAGCESYELYEKEYFVEST